VKNDFFSPLENEDTSDETKDSKRILFLEDETELVQTLTPLLEGRGFSVSCVTNGVEGLREIMAHDFAAIVCDIMMPNLPGDMFYRAVERTKPHLCKRFVFITGYKGNREVDEFIRRVKGVLLWKPFETAQLIKAIETILQKGAKE